MAVAAHFRRMRSAASGAGRGSPAPGQQQGGGSAAPGAAPGSGDGGGGEQAQQAGDGEREGGREVAAPGHCGMCLDILTLPTALSPCGAQAAHRVDGRHVVASACHCLTILTARSAGIYVSVVLTGCVWTLCRPRVVQRVPGGSPDADGGRGDGGSVPDVPLARERSAAPVHVVGSRATDCGGRADAWAWRLLTCCGRVAGMAGCGLAERELFLLPPSQGTTTNNSFEADRRGRRNALTLCIVVNT